MMIHKIINLDLMCYIFLLVAGLSASVTMALPSTSVCSPAYYSSNSTYQANVRKLFSNLSVSFDLDDAFGTDSEGENPNKVSAMWLCRGDVHRDLCRSCVQNATAELVQACPGHIWAIIYHEFCMFRYSNEPVVRSTIVDAHVNMSRPWAMQSDDASYTNEFIIMSDIIPLLDNLIQFAATNWGTMRLPAGGSRRISNGSRTIYGLVQCLPYLSSFDCSTCLYNATSQIKIFPIENTTVGGYWGTSCIIRYDIRKFYNETRLQELNGFLPPMPSTLTTPTGRQDNRKTTIIVASVVLSVVGLAAAVVFISMTKRKQEPAKQNGNGEGEDEYSVLESLQHDFSLIRTATCDFSEDNKLGQGGFGPVYKGKLPNGQDIAVKRLSKGSNQGELEFKNEVMLLARLQHRNLVRLLGFSLKGPEKLLVYEFVQNTSLDHFLFDPTKSSHLDWSMRYKIIRGIARGILYLHEDSRFRIIHRDLKTSNILIDGEINPKIADFGMARLYVPDETQEHTNRIVGTYGYMAPEYVTRGEFSIKSDVYSFGVVLLEIISGTKNNCFRRGESNDDLLSSAWKNWIKGTAEKLADPSLMEAGSSIPGDILRCIHISLLCVQENAADRPTMAQVVMMLNSLSIPLPMPLPPSYYVIYVYGGNSEYSYVRNFNQRVGDYNRSLQSNTISENEMSISDLQGR